jgi:hypothetical protein
MIRYSVITDDATEEYNVDKYIPLYSPVSRNINVY